MKRTGTIELFGVKHTLVWNLAVMESAETRNPTWAEGWKKAVKGNITERVLIFYEMLKAGHAYDIAKGEKPADIPTLEELRRECGPDELEAIATAMVETMTAGSKREVEAKAPKKGKGRSEAG